MSVRRFYSSDNIATQRALEAKAVLAEGDLAAQQRLEAAQRKARERERRRDNIVAGVVLVLIGLVFWIFGEPA